MGLTKEQISDLRSLHERVVNCEKATELTMGALVEAKRQFNKLLFEFEHESDTTAGFPKKINQG